PSTPTAKLRLREGAHREPFDAPAAGRELTRRELVLLRDRHDGAVLRVAERVELFDAQVEEAHHEAADREAVRDDEDAVRLLALGLPHHRLEEVRRAVVAVGRALAAAEAVIEPAVHFAELLLRGDL